MRFLILITCQIAFTQLQAQKLKTVWLDLGDDKKPVNIYTYRNNTDIVMVNIHDDERTSIDAAHAVLSKNGGQLIKIDNQRKRFLTFRVKNRTYEFDPNRMFSEDGIRASLDERGAVSEKAVEEVQEFAKKFLKLIPEKTYCLIALHNNTEGNYSIRSYMPGGVYQNDVKAYTLKKNQDKDDFFFTTDSLLHIQLAKKGYSSAWQDNQNAVEDGSLSVFYGRKGLRYINCEAQHGKYTQNVKMLVAAVGLLNTRK